MEQVNTGIYLHLAIRDSSFMRRRGLVYLCCAIVALLSLGILFLCPAAKEGALFLCNMLFDISEAANSYVYDYFAVSDTANPAVAAVLVGIITASVCCIAVLRKSRAIALIIMILIAGMEIYFGIVPSVFINVLLFAVPSLFLLRGTDLRICAVYFAVFFALSLFVSVAFPGVNTQLEAASENVRDHMDRVEQMIIGVHRVQQPNEIQKARHENRLNRQEMNENEEESQNYRSYRYQQELEQEISKPETSDYIRNIFLLLLTVVLLLTPFVPFIVFDSRRRIALKRRATFQSDDCSEAIRAMFMHMIAYLEGGGLTIGNKQFSDFEADVAALLPSSYVESYASAVALWQEAAYSDHIMTVEQRQAMCEVLAQTEDIVYNDSDRKTKFKLKYIECLHA